MASGELFGPSSALVVVDVQNDFADPAGSLAVRDGERVVDACNRAIDTARKAGSPIAFTLDWHPQSTPHFAKDGGTWPVHCVSESWGSELHPNLRVPPEAIFVRKGQNGEDGYSGFTMRDPSSGDEVPTELDEILRDRGIRSLVVAGLATDYCVGATALDGASLGYSVTVLTDAVAAVDLAPGDGDRMLERLRGAGVHIG